jgi:hypothetical protein
MAIVTKYVKPFAPVYKGAGQTEINQRGSQWYKSESIAFGGDTTNTVFVLPAGCLVVDGFVMVESAFDASGTSAAATATLTINNDTGTETLFDAANVGLQSTGLKPCTLAAAGVTTTVCPVKLLMDPSTSTAGSLRVYIEVVQLDSIL